MRVLMFRHAERENSGSSNPPLNGRGLKQAVKLAQQVDLAHLPRPTKLLSSPKMRAQQTLLPLQNQLGVSMQVLAELDERHNFESALSFSRRIQNFLTNLEQQSGVVYFVTHLDWLEESLHLIHSDTDLMNDRFQAWPPAQSMEFEIQDRLWTFQNLRQCQV